MKTKSDSSFVPYALRPTPYALRRGFTLVELLVTITIIAMVAGMSFGALQWARRAAAEEKTRQTIAKLNSIIMRKYESYRTRRAPISTTGLTPAQSAQKRLDALRELMQMEMPERFADITTNPINYSDWGSTTIISRPAASQRYLNILNSTKTLPTEDNASAECLYMIVSVNNPEELAHFRPDEIADTDEDGRPEFIDGWGMPIRFLRWPAGFVQTSSAAAPLQSGIATTDHDPFDTRKIDATAYKLTPLIYSAGPDKTYGLNSGDSAYFYDYATAGRLDPYASSGGNRIGAPLLTDTTSHLDNITNHDTSAAR